MLARSIAGIALGHATSRIGWSFLQILDGSRHVRGEAFYEAQGHPMLPGTPYDKIEPMQRWSTAAHAIAQGDCDPQGSTRFTIAASDSIASAGSCFSLRIAERLRARTRAYMSAEPPPAWVPPDLAERYGYVPFSARHGLIFSTLQLMQLLERAYGRLVPVERAWERDTGYVDPFRPTIAPEPFTTIAELEADRVVHLAAVRRLFETVDVFIFTMGLTEIWRDKRDGAVYPICPGLAGGTFDPAVHEFANLSFDDNRAAMIAFVERIRAINPTVKIVLTVSPISMGATMEPQHIVRATTYSKSVLRAVAEEIRRAYEFVDYFASYEMISPAFMGSDGFAENRRHVRADAADRVLDLFSAHYLRDFETTFEPRIEKVPSIDQRLTCDEDLFAR